MFVNPVTRGLDTLIRLLDKRNTHEAAHALYFDAEACEVPFETVSAAHPVRRLGQIEYIEPKAGVGHYCHAMVEREHLARDHGHEKTIMVSGPDWWARCVVTRHWHDRERRIQVHVGASSMSSAGLAFLERFDSRYASHRVLIPASF